MPWHHVSEGNAKSRRGKDRALTDIAQRSTIDARKFLKEDNRAILPPSHSMFAGKEDGNKSKQFAQPYPISRTMSHIRGKKKQKAVSQQLEMILIDLYRCTYPEKKPART